MLNGTGCRMNPSLAAAWTRAVFVCLIVPVFATLGGCREELSVYTTPRDMKLPDEVLKDCVVRFGQQNAWGQAGRFTELRCNGGASNQVESLAGIEVLSAVERLDVSFNAIKTLKPVAKLRRLQDLEASHNDISEIPADLSAAITTINLDHNRISNLDWISHFPALHHLAIGGNGIQDISALAGVPTLEQLVLARNRIRDISPLAALPNLRRLDIRGNLVTDLEPVTSLIALRMLDVSNNQIDSVEPLKGLHALIDLDLADNPISDISALQDAVALERLWLDGTRVQDFTPLQEMSRLEFVSLLRVEGLTCDRIDTLRHTFDTVMVSSSCD